MKTQTDEVVLSTILTFLDEIGMVVKEQELDDTTLLPGLDISKNTILMDRSRMKYPGDLLHEAGHLAVTVEEDRSKIGTPEMPPEWPLDGDEIATILWSLAAAEYLGLPFELIVHKHGYKNESDWIVQEYRNGNYIGLPLLEWMGMCVSEASDDAKPFPAMLKWLR